MEKIIVATGNVGKLREIKEIYTGLPFELVSLKEHFKDVPCIPEDGDTFFANAKQKALWVYDKTGISSLADDSGLEVDFLDGRPGVYSARFAGENKHDSDNVELLLSLCKECPPKKRTARFTCVTFLKLENGVELIGKGSCEGIIGYAPKGCDGFGYDPVFYPQGYNETFAQLSASVKNTISHRAQALAALRRELDKYLASR